MIENVTKPTYNNHCNSINDYALIYLIIKGNRYDKKQRDKISTEVSQCQRCCGSFAST